MAAMIAACVLVSADTVMWFRLERIMDRRLDAFASQARADGWRFTAEAGERGGWPLDATLTLRHPSLRFPAGAIVALPAVGSSAPPIVDNPAPGAGHPPDAGTRKLAYAVAWSGDALTLSVPPWRPREITLLASGTQSLSAAPAAGPSMPLRFWGARIAISLANRDDDAGGQPIALDVDALHVAVPGAGPDDVIRVAGMTGQLRWAGNAASLRLALRDIALPIMPGRPDDRIVQHARLELGLDRTGPETAAWFQPDAVLKLGAADIDWDGLGASLTGEARLRTDGALAGRFALAVDDSDRMLAKMRDAGLIDPGTATAARAVAGLITKSGAGPQMRVSLDLDHGVLSLGTIPLLRLPGSTPHQ